MSLKDVLFVFLKLIQKHITMKKITFLLLTLLLTSVGYAQFPEPFEGPDNLPEGWLVFDNGFGTSETWQQNPNGFALVLWDEDVPAGEIAEDWLVSPSYALTAENALLQFETTPFNAPDFGSTLSVRVQIDEEGSDRSDPDLYTTVQTFTELEFLPESVFNLAQVDLSDFSGEDVFIAFVYSNNDGDAWAIRNASFVALANNAPLAAINPDPENGSTVFLTEGENAEGQPVNQYIFGWELPEDSDDASEYLFELGTAPGVYVFSTTLPSNALTLTGLSFSTTYYWRVTPINIQGAATNPVEWVFTTEETLSNEEFIANNEFVHYTNNGRLFIQANVNLTEAMIFDMAGRQVLTEQINNANGSIDLNLLSSGMYMVRVATEDSNHSFKIVK